MSKNKLRKIALGLIGSCQENENVTSSKEDFIYLMAYNDGVLDFLKVLLKEQEESGNE